MTTGFKLSLLLTLIPAVALAQLASGLEGQPKLRLAKENGVPNQYIVALYPQPPATPGLTSGSSANRSAIEALADSYKVQPNRIWEDALPGFLCVMDLKQAQAMAEDPQVRFIQQDRESPLANDFTYCPDAPHNGTGNPGFPNSPQAIDCFDPEPDGSGCVDNWGLDRLDDGVLADPANRDGFYGFPSAPGATVHIYAIDTGITPGHHEFQDQSGASRIGAGVNASVPPTDPDRFDIVDTIGNSHGTHVAGMAAGKTHGVAKHAIIHPVRATTNSNIRDSALLESIQWILENHPAGEPGVANLSANNPAYPDNEAVALAIRALIASGIAMVQSAGNQAGQAADFTFSGSLYPSEVIVAGASTHLDARWQKPLSDPDCEDPIASNNCGSNSGGGVDFFAPGEYIVSSSNEGVDTYCWLSGTSMAAPHAAGAAALLLARFPNASPSALKKGLLLAAASGTLNPLDLGGPNRLLQMVWPTGGPPVAGSELLDTFLNASLFIAESDLLEDDFDWANRPLTLASIGAPDHGSLTPISGGWVYVPDSGFTGEDQFSYTIRNSANQTDSASVRISVGALDQPPVAVADTLIGEQDQNLRFSKAPYSTSSPNIMDNDFDPEPLSTSVRFVRFVRDPAHGELRAVLGVDHAYDYIPDPGFNGVDSFRYRIRDGNNQTAEAEVTVIVNESDPPPDVLLVAEFAPAPGAARVQYASAVADPPTFNYYYDPNLGIFAERPGGSCDNGAENPTYLKVKVDAGQDITACQYQASWDANPSNCSQDVLDRINQGDWFIIGVDNFNYLPGSCGEVGDPAEPHAPPFVDQWLHFTGWINGQRYDRRLNFRKGWQVYNVRFVASYVPAPGASRVTYESVEANPAEILSYHYDESLGNYWERPGETCNTGQNNTTYFQVRLKSDLPIQTCNFQASWDNQQIDCSQGVRDLLNSGAWIVLSTDDYDTDPSTCQLFDPLRPHVFPGVEHFMRATFFVNGMAYERRVRFTKQ